MTTEFASVQEDMTIQGVLNFLREVGPDVETIYYIYVKSKSGDLVGVMTLRELLLADPTKKISEFMIRDVINADVMEDQYEVAKKIAKYNLLALPVVENEKNIRGIITVDDAIDIVLPTAWKKKVPRMFR
jgi:Mg/Co/Ni transporter MgtE